MNSPTAELSLGRILIFLRRWAVKIFLCSLVVGAVTTVILLLLPRKYKSHISVFVTGTDSIAAAARVQAQLASLFGLSSGGNEYVTAILESDSVRITVINSLGLMKNEDFWWGDYKERTMEEALKVLDKHLELTAPQPPLQGAITLTAETVSPDLSQEICNQFLALLNQRTARESKSRSKFLGEQLENSKRELEKAEVALQNFAQQENVVVPLEDLGKREFFADVELKTQKILGEIQLKDLQARLHAPGGLNVRMALQSEIVGLEAKLGQLDAALAEKDTELDALPSQAKKYANLLRDVKSREKIFEIYLEHYELARMYEVGDSETRPYRIIDKPYKADEPVKRGALLKIILALIVGAGLGLSVAIFVEALEIAKEEERDILALKNAGAKVTPDE